jgi:hypothetical protein
LDTEGQIWGITSYFNPSRYANRYKNYRIFRDHLPIPLVAVELSFDGTFELSAGDAEIVIQFQGGSVMWQKERLLNIALHALPPACTAVVVLDADVVLEGGDSWVEPTRELLGRYSIVQPFSRAYSFPHGVHASELASLDESLGGYAIAYLRTPGQMLDMSTGLPWPVTGGAWAVRRAILDEHGIYDACIVGGGDHVVGYSMFGEFQKAGLPMRMDGLRETHYLRWARPFFEAVQGSVAFLPGRMGFLWHGDLRRRRYLERHDRLASFGFNPYEDIALDASGAWRWSSDKPQMHEFVRGYFAGRKEDMADGP